MFSMLPVFANNIFSIVADEDTKFLQILVSELAPQILDCEWWGDYSAATIDKKELQHSSDTGDFYRMAFKFYDWRNAVKEKRQPSLHPDDWYLRAFKFYYWRNAIRENEIE